MGKDSKVDTEERKEQITELYRTVLGREPDKPGLRSYTYSELSLEDIEAGMRDSSEFVEIQRKKNFSRQLETLGTGELLLMGSSPRTDVHVESLKSAGIVAILSLDAKFERPYNHSWCKFYTNVPLSKDKPISKDQVSEILNFIYTNVVVHGRKVFIHSDLGMSRAPMAIALFLMTEKKMPLMQALTIVTAKQSAVNPSRSLLQGELIEYLKDFTFIDIDETPVRKSTTTSISGKSGDLEFVSLTNNILMGCTLTDKMVHQFRSSDVDVVVDLNDSRQKLPIEAQWFSHIHLPLPNDQIKEMMPIVLKNVAKYSIGARVYVLCAEMPKLLLFAENYVKNSGDSALAGRMAALRAQMVSL